MTSTEPISWPREPVFEENLGQSVHTQAAAGQGVFKVNLFLCKSSGPRRGSCGDPSLPCCLCGLGQLQPGLGVTGRSPCGMALPSASPWNTPAPLHIRFFSSDTRGVCGCPVQTLVLSGILEFNVHPPRWSGLCVPWTDTTTAAPRGDVTKVSSVLSAEPGSLALEPVLEPSPPNL